MIYTVKGFSIVNEAEVDVFLEFPCFLSDRTAVGNLVSGFSAFSESSLYVWKFSVHVVLKPGLEGFEHHRTAWGMSTAVRQCGHSLALPFFGTDFPGGSDGKAFAYNAGDLGSIPGLGRSSGEGNGNPLQYPCLENPMDGGVW